MNMKLRISSNLQHAVLALGSKCCKSWTETDYHQRVKKALLQIKVSPSTCFPINLEDPGLVLHSEFPSDDAILLPPCFLPLFLPKLASSGSLLSLLLCVHPSVAHVTFHACLDRKKKYQNESGKEGSEDLHELMLSDSCEYTLSTESSTC